MNSMAAEIILIIDDDVTLNRMLAAQLKAAGFQTASAHRWSEAEKLLTQIEPALALIDMKLPDANGVDKVAALSEVCPVLMLTAYGTINQAVTAIKHGAQDFLTKPIDPETFDLVVRRTLAAHSMRRDYEYFRRQASSAVEKTLVGKSAAMQELRRWIGIVAPSDTTVLILGESGCGKELIAAAVHNASGRAKGNFVAIDCSTLQANLIESELFGHERGAFTGADRRKEGLIEVAAGGTVFLDEIGEMAPQLQAKLLRVLETGRFRRVGGAKDLAANVRFVAATNRDLEAMCRKGDFREDLYYRLSAFVLKAPPLRERLDDIPLLAEHFLQTRDFARNAQKTWSPAALEALTAYQWPGNVRELRNIVERAALVSGEESAIRVAHLGPLRSRSRLSSKLDLSFENLPTLEQLGETYVDKLLAMGTQNRAELAKILGVSERQIYRMLKDRRA
jgi:DNA-binding NtrC family response regulator